MSNKSVEQTVEQVRRMTDRTIMATVALGALIEVPVPDSDEQGMGHMYFNWFPEIGWASMQNSTARIDGIHSFVLHQSETGRIDFTYALDNDSLEDSKYESVAVNRLGNDKSPTIEGVINDKEVPLDESRRTIARVLFGLFDGLKTRYEI